MVILLNKHEKILAKAMIVSTNSQERSLAIRQKKVKAETICLLSS
jgi:hypothetical protein